MTATTSSDARAPEDQILVQRVQAGDRTAFDQLVRKYYARVLRLTQRYTGDPADAEDAAQDAFMMAYRGLGNFRRDSSFYTWLYRISVNSAKNVLLARARGAGTLSLQQEEVEDEAERLGLTDAETPEELVLTDELCLLVNAAVRALPAEQRTAVMLRELEGRSYEAIAQQMGTPVGTVRSRIYRAREIIDQRLRAVFEPGLGRGRSDAMRDRSAHAPLVHPAVC